MWITHSRERDHSADNLQVMAITKGGEIRQALASVQRGHIEVAFLLCEHNSSTRICGEP